MIFNDPWPYFVNTICSCLLCRSLLVCAGFMLWQVKSLEEAIEWVKRFPNPHAGESEVEIRQVFEPEDFAYAFSEEDIQQEKTIRAQLADQAAKK